MPSKSHARALSPLPQRPPTTSPAGCGLIPVWPADKNINASGGLVTFEPGARSVWHTHPVGQRLVVVSGVGLTQEWGKPVQEIRPGDAIWCPPGIKHWHGAAPTTAMTHLAVTGTVDGKNVTWMEKVTDEQYNAR
jgi:quercetin dioxygenase-like cupin family protein